jgi:hypothetical protein
MYVCIYDGGIDQGCQMAYFRTQNPSLGKFLEGSGMEKVGIFFAYFGI